MNETKNTYEPDSYALDKVEEFINDLARKYANVSQFKSDFPHDYNSVHDGFTEGFKTATKTNLLYLLLKVKLWY